MSLYYPLKGDQIALYINQISLKLGYENTSKIRKIYDKVYNFYRDLSYVCAFFEKNFSDILTEYRDGEPRMPEKFINKLSVFMCDLDERMLK